jgi:hypothetical protein
MQLGPSSLEVFGRIQYSNVLENIGNIMNMEWDLNNRYHP